MQRSFIFVATIDPQFENTALNAIFESRHGVRRARDLIEASRILKAGDAHEIALAIIDMDFSPDALSLLQILGGCEPDFPILAIHADRNLTPAEESIGDIAMGLICKPVDAADLQRRITDLCTEPARRSPRPVLRTTRPKAPPRIHLNLERFLQAR